MAEVDEILLAVTRLFPEEIVRARTHPGAVVRDVRSAAFASASTCFAGSASPTFATAARTGAWPSRRWLGGAGTPDVPVARRGPSADRGATDGADDAEPHLRDRPRRRTRRGLLHPVARGLGRVPSATELASFVRVAGTAEGAERLADEPIDVHGAGCAAWLAAAAHSPRLRAGAQPRDKAPWSQGHADAPRRARERGCPGDDGGKRGLASMQTRPEGHVNPVGAERRLRRHHASMQTRPEGHVNRGVGPPRAKHRAASMQTRPEGHVNDRCLGPRARLVVVLQCRRAPKGT